MANFRYVAKSMDGKTVRGTMEASGESSLLQQLKEQGLFLVEAKDKDNTKKYKKFGSGFGDHFRGGRDLKGAERGLYRYSY